MLDVLALSAIALAVWLWLQRNPGHALIAGPGGAFDPTWLDREFNFRDVTPNGPGPVGAQLLRHAAPLVLAGPNSLGYGIEPADQTAADAVNRYAAARVAGELPA